MKTAIISIFIVLFFAKTAFAQNYFGLLNSGIRIASIGVNANPNINTNADYLLGFDTPNHWFERWGIAAQVNFPIFSQKGFDFDFRLGAGAVISVTEKFKSIAGLSWNFSRTEDINGRYVHSGFKLDFLPGFYGQKWAFAPHFSINYQPWINIKHSAYAMNAFQDLYPNNDGQYEAPKNGWFYQNHIILQTGAGIAYTRPNWHLNFTAGFQHQPNKLGIVALPDVGIMPFYGGVNAGLVLDRSK